MPFIDEFADLLADTVTWRPLSGRDRYGAPTYAAGTTFAARLVREHKLVRDAQGDEVVSTAHVWLGGVPVVAPDDQVELSDGSTPVILAVDRPQDETGDAYTKVYFR